MGKREKRVQIVIWVIGLVLGAACLIWWFVANPFPGVMSLWDLEEKPWCWIGKVCVGNDGAPCPMAETGSLENTLPGMTWNETLGQCVYCNTRACLEQWYSKVTLNGIEQQWEFCPRRWLHAECHDYFTDDWDLWPPA